MRRLFSDENRIQKYLDIEAALAGQVNPLSSGYISFPIGALRNGPPNLACQRSSLPRSTTRSTQAVSGPTLMHVLRRARSSVSILMTSSSAIAGASCGARASTCSFGLRLRSCDATRRSSS